MAIRRVGSNAAPEQPENVKQAIADLIPEIETVGNKLVEDLEKFIGRLQGSSDPADKAAAQAVLQRLKDFSLFPETSEVSSGSTATPPQASTSSTKTGSVRGALGKWWRTIKENAREDGGSSKNSTPETKA